MLVLDLEVWAQALRNPPPFGAEEMRQRILARYSPRQVANHHLEVLEFGRAPPSYVHATAPSGSATR